MVTVTLAVTFGLPLGLNDAVIVTGVLAVTSFVVAVNVAEVAFAGMVIDAGTVSAALLLERYTVVAAAARPLRLAMPLALLPPVMVEAMWMYVSTGGCTVSAKVLVTLPSVAVTVTDLSAVTFFGVKLKDTLVAPGAIFTVVTGGIDPSELESPMTAPLGPARPVR